METKWNLLKQIQDQRLRQASGELTIKVMVKPMVLVGIYHPPPSEINWHSAQEFIRNFLDFYGELGQNLLTFSLVILTSMCWI